MKDGRKRIFFSLGNESKYIAEKNSLQGMMVVLVTMKNKKIVTPRYDVTIFLMERVTGIEPVFQPWQGRIIAII